MFKIPLKIVTNFRTRSPQILDLQLQRTLKNGNGTTIH